MFHTTVATVALTLIAGIIAIYEQEKTRLKYFPAWHERHRQVKATAYDQLCFLISAVLFVEAVYWLGRWGVSQWA